MNGLDYRDFFVHPVEAAHRRYEALRSVFVEQQPMKKVAQRNERPARAEADALLKQFPNNAGVHVLRGDVAAFFDNDEPTQRKMFKRALELDPTVGVTIFDEAVELFEKGQLEMAKSSFFTTLSMDPDKYVESNYFVAEIWLKLGDLGRAQQWYEWYLDFAPNGRYAGLARASLKLLN